MQKEISDAIKSRTELGIVSIKIKIECFIDSFLKRYSLFTDQDRKGPEIGTRGTPQVTGIDDNT